jgi:hypothetical protein
VIALLAVPLAVFPQNKQDSKKSEPARSKSGKDSQARPTKQSTPDPAAKERIDRARTRMTERDKQVDRILNKQKGGR